MWMRRAPLSSTIARAALIAAGVVVLGCGSAETARTDGGDGGDARVCDASSECDDDDPCTVDRCVNRRCETRAVDCQELTDDCNVGFCYPSNGQCVAQSRNDGALCQTKLGAPGACKGGLCNATPVCEVRGQHGCNVGVSPMVTAGASVLDSYACATGLTGPEYAYAFWARDDARITLTLHAEVDLDLLVLDGDYCAKEAQCVVASTTVGSGDEAVAFDGKRGHHYTLVVDGRDGAAGAFALAMDCEGCRPRQTITCDQSVLGDTTSAYATSLVGGLTCSKGPGGPEEVYTVEVPPATRVDVTLQGAATEHDLVAFVDEAGKCATPTCTRTSGNDNPSSDQVTLAHSSPLAQHWSMVVDARAQGGAYQLQVACSPLCRDQGVPLSCASGELVARNDGDGSSDAFDHYSCAGAMNLGGHERIYRFSPTTAGDYTLTIDGLSGDLDLFVLAADGSWADAVCDPSSTCAGASAHAGIAAESVSFAALAYHTYYVVIDAKAGVASDFRLRLASPACPPPPCQNGVSPLLGCTYRRDARRSDDPVYAHDVIDDWGCGVGLTGSEVVYVVPIDADGTYEIELTDAGPGVRMFVIPATGFVCDPKTACVPTLDGKATFTAKAGDAYYVAIDTATGASGAFRVQLRSDACGAPVCYAGGAALDCAGPKSITGRNDALSASRNVDRWSCIDSDRYTGAETVHAFLPPGPGLYTVELSGLLANLDLLVLETDGACAPTAPCATTSALGDEPAISTNDDPADGERVTFYARPGKSYYLVIDGRAGADEDADVASDYTLSITSCDPE